MAHIDRGRLHPSSKFWDGKRKPFIIGVVFSLLLLQLLFLGNLSYLYGVVFRSAYKVHNLQILNVNLDESTSDIQASVTAAYEGLKGQGFFTLEQRPSADYPSIEAARNAVCKGDFWAAVVVNNGASASLSSALVGAEPVRNYNSSGAITLVYNSAKYPTATLGDVIGNLQTLMGAANAAYGQVVSAAAQSLNVTSPAAVNAFRNPISSTAVDIMPTDQGTRVLYNTVSMVMPIIQQFFFLMALNGISNTYKLYTSLKILYALLMRAVLSTAYTFVSSLCMTGYIWAFREDWGVDAGQFFMTWMVLWLYMFINFGLIDALTGIIPMSFVPFFLITWVILNVGSTIYPMALTAGFYHWGYALPAYNTYNTLVDVWSSGCNPVLYRTLPILFAWAIVGIILANVGMYRRCVVAVRAEKAEEEAIQKRIAEANSPFPSISGSSSSRDQEKASSDTPALRRGNQAARKETQKPDVSANQPKEIAYMEGLTQQVSRMGIRMPFADTIEGIGSSRLTRRNTAT